MQHGVLQLQLAWRVFAGIGPLAHPGAAWAERELQPELVLSATGRDMPRARAVANVVSVSRRRGQAVELHVQRLQHLVEGLVMQALLRAATDGARECRSLFPP